MSAAKTRFQTKIDEINANERLSLQGRREEAQKETALINEEIAQLQRREEALIASETKSLSQQIAGRGTGSGADVISFRDAQDRAARLTTREEAEDAMRRALTLDDMVLARAILDHAMRKGFRDAMNLFIEQNPSAGQAITDLARVYSRDNDIRSEFARSLTYSAPTARVIDPASTNARGNRGRR